MSSAIDREVRVAFWKIHILHHAGQRTVYGLWLLDELAEHGHRVSPGTLYPLLSRMETNGWLRCSSSGRGKARRSYQITSAGQKILKQIRAEIAELYEEVVLGKEPHHEDHDRAGAAGRRPRRA